MTIKTEVGATILIVLALIAGVAIIVGGKNISNDFDTIESSMSQNKAVLGE